MDPKELEDLARLLALSSPFACIKPNPSLVLTEQNSWGRTEEIFEAEHVELVRAQLPVMAYVGLTARAIEFDNGTNPTQLHLYARIRYGNGGVLTENVLDMTGGWSQTVLGSTFHLDVFLADDDGFPPEAGSGASAKVQGWGCVGVTSYPQ